ncbi:type II toxin-antitoxin system VapC family toxin [Acidiphilium angustum]|uniref:type II toxin-antitoxin system VapC family toxin n=1 Tax=Acidiphilium angustum TaxID=523 RepID=UPI0004942DBA|nr:type II toxin-antitoxin system VapC family toxin [Acidiphilium angustum]
MRIALDTNVLVRYLTWDDATPPSAAADLIEAAESLVLSTIVLCETVWVLRRAYKFPPASILAVLRSLTKMPAVELDRPLVEAGIECLAAGGDFADGVILAEAVRAKADHLVSFDETLAKFSSNTNRLNG